MGHTGVRVADKIVTFQVTLAEKQARAFALFLKRSHIRDFRRHAADEIDAKNMDAAAGQIHSALSEAGVSTCRRREEDT